MRPHACGRSSSPAQLRHRVTTYTYDRGHPQIPNQKTIITRQPPSFLLNQSYDCALRWLHYCCSRGVVKTRRSFDCGLSFFNSDFQREDAEFGEPGQCGPLARSFLLPFLEKGWQTLQTRTRTRIRIRPRSSDSRERASFTSHSHITHRTLNFIW